MNSSMSLFGKYIIIILFLSVTSNFCQSQDSLHFFGINRITLSNQNDTICFKKQKTLWTAEAVKNIDLEQLDVLVEILSNHTLSATNLDFSDYIIGSIEFGNDSTSHIYYVTNAKGRYYDVIGVNGSFYKITSEGHDNSRILVVLLNANVWNWTDMRLCAGMSEIKNIEFISESFSNYKSRSKKLFEKFQSLKYIETDTTIEGIGNPIGTLIVKHKGGKKKFDFYKRLKMDAFSTFREDSETLVIITENSRYTGYYYYFGSLFKFEELYN